MTEPEQSALNNAPVARVRAGIRDRLAHALIQWRIIRRTFRDPAFHASVDLEQRMADLSASLARLVAGLSGGAAIPAEPAPAGKVDLDTLRPDSGTPATAVGGKPGDPAFAPPSQSASGLSDGFDTRSIEQGPSLATILERLRRPTDTDARVLTVPQPKSLSDEDLLGLEMMHLVGAAPDETRSLAAPTMDAAMDPSQADSAIAAVAAAIHDDPSGVFDEVAFPHAPSDTGPGSGATSNDGSQRRGRVESAYSAALENTAFPAPEAPIVEPLRPPAVTTTGAQQAQRTAPAHASPVVELSFGQDGLSLSGFDDGQDAFVRSTIEHSNLAKLEQLRQQLQEIFQAAGQAVAGNPVEPETSLPAPPASGVLPGLESDGHDETPVTSCAPDHGSDRSPDDSLLHQLFEEQTGFRREPARTELLALPPPDSPRPHELSPRQPNPASEFPNALPTETRPEESTMNTTEQSRTSPARENHFSGLSSAAYLTNLDLEETTAATRPAPAQPKPASQPQRNSGPGPETGEPDVADYMQQLLGRLRGGSTQTSAATEANRSAPGGGTATAQPAQSAGSAPEGHPAPMEPVQPLKPEEFVPRASAPEKNMNIDALRQLANQSTRSAVNVFANNQKKALYFAQLAAVGGGVMGAALFAFLAPKLGAPFYVLALLCLGGAGFAGYRFARENVGMSSARRQQPKQS